MLQPYYSIMRSHFSSSRHKRGWFEIFLRWSVSVFCFITSYTPMLRSKLLHNADDSSRCPESVSKIRRKLFMPRATEIAVMLELRKCQKLSPSSKPDVFSPPEYTVDSYSYCTWFSSFFLFMKTGCLSTLKETGP